MTRGQPCAVGGVTAGGAGREVSWRISRRSVAIRGGQPPLGSRDFVTVHRPLCLQLRRSRMDMKKRIILELRNRNPADVSRSYFNNTGTVA